MRVVVTGASGFIGRRLVTALLARGQLAGAARHGPQPLSELVLVDARPPTVPTAHGSVSIETHCGDICDPGLREKVFARDVDSLFHLAATLTAEAQADPRKGMRVNVRGLLDLLEAGRGQRHPPRVVFPSSIAAFGGDLPDVVDDHVVQTPQTSYGCHKVIAEQLINDYSRHRVIDGRALRLPIVLVRPPAEQPSVSDQVAAIVREPLAGRDFTCPFRPDTSLTVASVQRVAEALLDIHEVPGESFGDTRAVNLPALTVTPAEMVAALVSMRLDGRIGSVEYAVDPGAQKVVDSWPRHFVSQTASRLGLCADASFSAIVDAYLKDQRMPEE